jgi:RNA polymerase sigma-70 factor (ECF subfamily)
MELSIMNSSDQFEKLVSEFYEPLFRFAVSLTRTESDARDLTQHTFYIWATKGHQLRDFSKVKTWLFTTLHRAFLEGKRRQNRFPHHGLEEVLEQLPMFPSDHAHQADCSEVLPALAKVDEVYQAAVALFYLEDCSYKEIAAILEVPLGTVKSRIARGIAQLREILLSGDPGASSSSSIRERPVTENQNPAPSPRNGPIDSANRDYDEWDFSSTRMRELFGAA